MKRVLRLSQLARHFQDAVLGSLPEAIVVLRSRAREPVSFGGGGALLQRCLDGPDASPLAGAINDLLQRSSGFSLSVRMADLEQVMVRGLRIGDGAALFLRTQERFTGKVVVRNEKPRTLNPAGASILAAVSVCRPEDAATQTESSRVGAIVIGTDGRLKKYDRAFARLWSLRDDELRGEPLWTDIAARCIARDGRNLVWDIVSFAAASAAPERLNNWGALTGSDGRPLFLSVARLEDGTTRVAFAGFAFPPETKVSGTTAMAA